MSVPLERPARLPAAPPAGSLRAVLLLAAVVGCLLLVCLVIVYPSIVTALALLREQRVLGKLYWHWRTALDRRGRKTQ